MGTTDKSDKPSKDQVDQQDQADTQADAKDVVEDAEVVEDVSPEVALDDSAAEEVGEAADDETPVEIEEPRTDDAVADQSNAHEADETFSSILPILSADKLKIIGLILFPPSNEYFRGSINSDSEYSASSLSKA